MTEGDFGGVAGGFDFGVAGGEKVDSPTFFFSSFSATTASNAARRVGASGLAFRNPGPGRRLKATRPCQPAGQREIQAIWGWLPA